MTWVLESFSQKQTFAIATELNLKAGDVVQITVTAQHLFRAAVIMYLMPLCALFSGAKFAESLLPADLATAELIISGSALLSFLLSRCLIKPLQQRFLNPQDCQPVIEKKV